MMGHQVWVFLLPILCSVLHHGYSIDSGPIVETSVGIIRGQRNNEDGYSLYMGIPYATVDENNPFGAAQPHPKLEGIFEANDDSARCPQVEEFNNTITGSLDCLHLNIYVPDTATPTNKLPVLVWIYGGGFNFGFAGRYLYGPKYLVRHDIIFVTLNYRVGPYGFMCLDTPSVPGNNGLKDQKIALEWIKDNIEAFAGDSDKITIYGMSVGGITVDAHYIYGDHKLFDKLIMHSGTALIPWVVHADELAALKLAEDLGFTTNDNNEAIRFLSGIDPAQVIASNQALGIRYGLCVEKQFQGVERYVHDHPINVKGLNASNKSVLLAYNRDEWQVIYALMAPELFPMLSNTFMNDLLNYFDLDSEQIIKLEAIVRQFYMGDEDFTTNVQWNLGEYASDFQFIHSTVRSIKKYVKEGSRNVYHFVFSYDGDRNFVKQNNNITHLDMVVHADDLGYLFDVSYMETPSERDQLAIDRITTLWANFVKYGNPTPQPTELLPVSWEPATVDTIPYLELDSEVHTGNRYYHKRMAFWDLFYELNHEAQKGFRNSAPRVEKDIFYLSFFMLSLLLSVGVNPRLSYLD